MSAICGIDTGGTFTDLAIVSSDGTLRVMKTLSTPPDFDRGVLSALETVDQPGADEGVEIVAHGTTVGTNAVVEQKTPPVALITTAGFRDIVLQMRGSGRVAGLSNEQVINLHETSKPAPLVRNDLIFEVDERIDCAGQVVVAPNREQFTRIAADLTDRAIGSVAVCFLWSFLNAAHERFAREVLQQAAPNLQVSLSCEIAPRWGEYERFVAAILNASLQPVMTSYVTSLESGTSGANRRLFLMQRNGGTTSAREAVAVPLLTLHSGPVGGVMACKRLGEELSMPNIIATDMGGTSFDVGIIHDYTPAAARTSVVRQYEYFVSSVQVESIGAGGGSIASVDPITGALTVGPESAGSMPGPVAYGRGGTRPTVTDADLILGRLNPANFWGGQLELDVAAAETAISALAHELSIGVVETAAGIVEIVDNRMADLTRAMTIRRGLDPREFVLFAYGGAGPCHVGAYARELGCKGVVIPRGNAASVWSAYGIALADVMKVHEASQITLLPAPAARFNDTYDALEAEALENLQRQGVSSENVTLQREADVRYKNQVYELSLPMSSGKLADDDVARLQEGFVRLYEEVYGEGAGFRGMGIELVALRVRSSGHLGPLARRSDRTEHPPTEFEPTTAGRRDVYWSRAEGFLPTDIYTGDDAIAPGARIRGPAVLELTDTTISIHPNQELKADGQGNLHLVG
jgi:N-methylhydantoinase A